MKNDYIKIDSLTRMQRAVVELLCVGQSTEQVALALGIAVETVKRHIYEAMERTGAENRTHLAVQYAVRHCPHCRQEVES